ncbi:MAG TPA: 50S ribosomal protein L4, partial [Candidatus Hydrogenedentes bacterium]|nr:50S ribosomal protein L4 [Candidatus Hydrogenedentota bacterium]
VSEPKTRPFANMIRKLEPDGRRTLVVTAEKDDNVLLSARNIPRVEVRAAADLNALDVLLAHRVVIQEEALAKLEERLS